MVVSGWGARHRGGEGGEREREGEGEGEVEKGETCVKTMWVDVDA